MVIAIIFAVIGICLIVSGGIVVGSIGKLTGNDTAKTNIKNVGIFMNILPGIVSCLIAGFFAYKAKQNTGVLYNNNPSPIVVSGLVGIFGICLIVSGGIIVGSVGKLSGNATASKNIKNVGYFMNIIPGVVGVLGAGGLFMYNRKKSSLSPSSAASPESPRPVSA